jgi:hypothetical protein
MEERVTQGVPAAPAVFPPEQGAPVIPTSPPVPAGPVPTGLVLGPPPGLVAPVPPTAQLPQVDQLPTTGPASPMGPTVPMGPAPLTAPMAPPAPAGPPATAKNTGPTYSPPNLLPRSGPVQIIALAIASIPLLVILLILKKLDAASPTRLPSYYPGYSHYGAARTAYVWATGHPGTGR